MQGWKLMYNPNGSKNLNFEWNHTQLKFKPETVEKNESTIGPTSEEVPQNHY